MVDSLELYKEGFYKAVRAVDQLKALNDTTFAISAQKLEQMNTALVTLGARHFIGMVLGFLFLASMAGLLIWKGLKIKRHYETVIDFSNISAHRVAELEERLQEYDDDFEPNKEPFTQIVTKWPKHYVHIIYGSVLAFFLLYFFVAF